MEKGVRPATLLKKALAQLFSREFCETSKKTFITEHLWMPSTLLKKETLAQVFSCEFCETSENTFFTEYLRATASWFHDNL